MVLEASAGFHKLQVGVQGGLGPKVTEKVTVTHRGWEWFRNFKVYGKVTVTHRRGEGSLVSQVKNKLGLQGYR